MSFSLPATRYQLVIIPQPPLLGHHLAPFKPTGGCWCKRRLVNRQPLVKSCLSKLYFTTLHFHLISNHDSTPTLFLSGILCDLCVTSCHTSGIFEKVDHLGAAYVFMPVIWPLVYRPLDSNITQFQQLLLRKMLIPTLRGLIVGAPL